MAADRWEQNKNIGGEDQAGRAAAIGRGESRLRLIGDRTLAELYRSGEIFRIIERWFPNAKPSDMLTALYFMQSLGE